MSGLEAAGLGAATSLGIAAYAAISGFSARHDQCHDTQALETRRLIDEFEKLRRAGDIADEDYELFTKMKENALQSGKEYRNAIADYKKIKALDFIEKWRLRLWVRSCKRFFRWANQDLQDHYYNSSSCGSDASSITAQSGSPPGSEDIREWVGSISGSEGDENEGVSKSEDEEDGNSISDEDDKAELQSYIARMRAGRHTSNVGEL